MIAVGAIFTTDVASFVVAKTTQYAISFLPESCESYLPRDVEILIGLSHLVSAVVVTGAFSFYGLLPFSGLPLIPVILGITALNFCADVTSTLFLRHLVRLVRLERLERRARRQARQERELAWEAAQRGGRR